ncbi:MAG: SGNH/GDSL hydrolase family protein [Eubacterium sp.]|nr:SGNH/GDSL hydrolase family protein [Eubacterium sp.]
MSAFMKRKACIQKAVTAILVVCLLAGLQRLVVPKYAENLLEGGFTNAYYSEAGGHQVLMVGDCELYENFDPVTLWENYGIDSYIRGNAQQLPWQSYYLLKEALRYETPKVAVFNVLELKYNEPQKEEYNRLTIDGMKWSIDKWNIIRASMTEEESMMEYIFPILRYHARIMQLTKEDLEYYWNNEAKHTVAGYYMRIDASPYEIGQWGGENYVGTYSDEHALANPGPKNEKREAQAAEGWSAEADGNSAAEGWPAETEAEAESRQTDKVGPLGEHAMHYLDLIRELCEEKGIRLLLVKAPSVSPIWYEEWEDQIVAYAKQYGLDYINFLYLVDEIGIDFSADTYDEGLHMNYSGAVKCADYLGGYLAEHYKLEDRRKDPSVSAKWQKIKETRNLIYKTQQKELEENGEVVSY